jgi:hypothetical protein
LARLDDELHREPHSWADLIMLRNTGPVLSGNPLPGDRISNRGFNAVRIGKDGSPSHYLKIRPHDHDRFQREAEVHCALSTHSAGRRWAPLAETFVDGPIRILAIEFLEGERFDVLLKARGRTAAWHRLVGSLLDESWDLWTVLEEVLGTGEKPTRSLTLDTSGESIHVLRELGLDVTLLRQLEERVQDLALSSVPQHGDLWPSNILRTDASWWVLDFETCGDVDLPFYDLFHLMRGAASFATDWAPGAWLRRWAEDGVRQSSLRRAVHRQAQSLTPRELEGALVCYLVDFPVRLFRRGATPGRLAPWLRELEVLPGALDEGLLEKAVWGGSP